MSLMNRKISRSVFEGLHKGLQRTGVKVWHWEVIQDDQLRPTDEPLTRADLALERRSTTPQPTPEQANEEQPSTDEQLPTLEQYIAAGYHAENYAAFLENEKARTAALRAQLETEAKPDDWDD